MLKQEAIEAQVKKAFQGVVNKLQGENKEQLDLILDQANKEADSQQSIAIAADQRTAQLANINSVLALFAVGTILNVDMSYVAHGAIAAFIMFLLAGGLLAFAMRPGRGFHEVGSDPSWSADKLTGKTAVEARRILLATIEARLLVNRRNMKVWSKLSFWGLLASLCAPLVALITAAISYYFFGGGDHSSELDLSKATFEVEVHFSLWGK